ncbi:MAG: hypothetical protein N2517_06285 [Ignavibacteria bacterium]|nr:hypothetical protein [Ignavibacteria bacterium]
MRKLHLFLILAFLGTSCFSIRTPYIPTRFYSLTQEAFSFKNIATIDAIILMRDFLVPSNLLGTNLFFIHDDGSVEKFYYHKFSTDYQEAINDFIRARLNLSRAFSFSILSTNSSLLPEYVLEGEVLEFYIYSKRKDKVFVVQISIQVTLTPYKPLASERNIILSKIYSYSIEKKNIEVNEMSKELSKGLSSIVDKMIFDIQSAIIQYKSR